MGNQITPSASSTNEKNLLPAPSDLRKDEEQCKREEVRQTSAASSSREPGAEVSNNPQHKYIPRMFDVWAFGVNTVIGGQFYGWNEGMLAGFGTYAIGQALVGFAYVNLSLSLAEICSTISFSGGAYGMTRVVLGFYVGFLVAAFELMEYITYISAAASFIANFLCQQLEWDENYSPLICLMFFIFMIGLVMEGNHIFWQVNKIIAIGLIAIMAIYVFGSLQFTNFDRYARLNGDDDAIIVQESDDRKYWFAGGMVAFLRAIPLMTWGFGGIEATALVTDIIHNPRVNVPYGMVAAVLTLFVCMIAVMFVASALPPGLRDLADMEYYMDSGFMLMGMSATAARWLVLPGQVAMGGGFFLPAAKLYHAMSESHLVPKFMQVHHTAKVQQDVPAENASIGTNTVSRRETVTNQHHQWAIIYVSCVAYALCLVDFYVPDFHMDSIPILLAQFTYFSDLYAYYQLKQVFNIQDHSNNNKNSNNSNNSNNFVNPFGIVGAIISAIMFAFTAIGVILYSDNNYMELIFVVSFGIILTIYYEIYAKHYQIFSEEEQKKLLSLHVITNNRRKKKSHKKSSKKSSFFPTFLTNLVGGSASQRQSSSRKRGSAGGSIGGSSIHSQSQQHPHNNNNNHNQQQQQPSSIASSQPPAHLIQNDDEVEALGATNNW